MLVFRRIAAWAATVLVIPSGADAASPVLGQPSPWQLGLQQSVTPVMDNIVSFHDFLLYIITAITAFVLLLLVLVIVKFNARANPTPARTTHNTLLEMAWTIVPIAILVVIAVPSFKLLFFQLVLPPIDLTVKATGKQWFWSYSYPDHGQFEFDSLLVKDGERKAEQPRLLAVDNEMVVPVNRNVRVITTGSDVIHAFAVPAFGIKVDFDPRAHQRDLVQGDPGRCLLRSVLGIVRQGSRLHADCSPRGERAGLCHLGRAGEAEIRPRQNGAADQCRIGGALAGSVMRRDGASG